MKKARRWLAIIAAGLSLAAALWPARPLTEAERESISEVLPPTLDDRKIRIARAPLPAALTGFVVANRITFRRGYYVPDFSADPYKTRQLIHEAAHVWLHQRHGWWMGLAAPLEHLRRGDRVYVADDLSDPAKLGQEQIARLFEDLYWRRHRGEDVRSLEAVIAEVN